MTSLRHGEANLNNVDWESQIEEQMWATAREAAVRLLERRDEELAKRREPGLAVVGFRERRVVTRFGDITIRRRLYRDRQRKGRFLLDETLGLEKRSLLSSGVKELALFLSSLLPFGKCEEVLRRLLPCGVSHTTLHRQVGRVIDPCLAVEEAAIDRAFEKGEAISVGQRQPERLHLEADGVSVALQREKARRGEIKVGIAYEGWEPAPGRDRYQLKEKTVYMRLVDGERFWQGFSLKLGGRYDASQIEHTVVNGDGATWVREGSAVMGGDYQLDRFHLRRALMRGLGGDMGLANDIYRRCVKGDYALADALLVERQSQCDAEESLQVGRLRAYLMENAGGLADYRIKLGGEALRGMGAMEGNVDKLVACRMKRRGMSWTRRGADRMARLLELRRDGRLEEWTRPKQRALAEARPRMRPVSAPPERAKRRSSDAVASTAGNMPALYGPHRNREWARRLNDTAHGGWNN